MNGTTRGTGGRDRGVYKVANGAAEAGRLPFSYYIEQDGAVYRVCWDGFAGSWRVIDPAQPWTLAYAVPVQLNEAGRWLTHDARSPAAT